MQVICDPLKGVRLGSGALIQAEVPQLQTGEFRIRGQGLEIRAEIPFCLWPPGVSLPYEALWAALARGSLDRIGRRARVDPVLIFLARKQYELLEEGKSRGAGQGSPDRG